jgi:hypothetical protein
LLLLYLPLDKTSERQAMADPLNKITQAAGGASTLVSTTSSHNAQDAGRKGTKTIFKVKGGVARKINLAATSKKATPWKAKRTSMLSDTSAAHTNVNEGAGTGKSEQDVVTNIYTDDATTHTQTRSLQLLLFAGAGAGASVELTEQPVQLQSKTKEGARPAPEAAQGQEWRDTLDVVNPLVASPSDAFALLTAESEGHGQSRSPTAESEPPPRFTNAEVAEANARAFI